MSGTAATTQIDTPAPLLSPAVARRLAATGRDARDLPAGSGHGGRLVPGDLPEEPAVRAATVAPGPVPGPSGGRRPITPAESERAARLREDLDGTAQLTSVAPVDLSARVEDALATTDAATVHHGVRPVLLGDVVAAAVAVIGATPEVAAVLEPDAATAVVPERIDVGVIVPDGMGGHRAAVVAGADRLAPDALRRVVAGVAAGTASDAVAHRTSPLEPPRAVIVVHDRLGSGILLETPILRRPAALALCVGELRREAVVAADGGIGARWACLLSLTYDHRVIDGADAARFLAEVRSLLER